MKKPTSFPQEAFRYQRRNFIWWTIVAHTQQNHSFLYRVTVDTRQHCTDGSFDFCRWRAHIEALSEDSGPEALSTHGQYFALQVFYEFLKHSTGELYANCCRTITMTRYKRSAVGGGSRGRPRAGRLEKAR